MLLNDSQVKILTLNEVLRRESTQSKNQVELDQNCI